MAENSKTEEDSGFQRQRELRRPKRIGFGQLIHLFSCVGVVERLDGFNGRERHLQSGGGKPEEAGICEETHPGLKVDDASIPGDAPVLDMLSWRDRWVDIRISARGSMIPQDLASSNCSWVAMMLQSICSRSIIRTE